MTVPPHTLNHLVSMHTPSLSPAGESNQKKRIMQKEDGESGTVGGAGLGEDVAASFHDRLIGMGRCGGNGNVSEIFSGTLWLFP